MIRTQIYLTSRQRGELAAIARNGGMKQSELIRQAVDQFIEKRGRDRRQAVLRAAAGIWKDRTDLLSQRAVRESWDRS